ncbi:MAG: hypothetical protein U1A27_12170 [Phycisphaerae bacterium]
MSPAPVGRIVLPVVAILTAACPPPARGAAEFRWAHFDPYVIRHDRTAAVDLVCLPDGTFTAVRLAPAWAAGEIALAPRGAGVYGVALAAADLVGGLVPDDVNRRFAGYLRLYDGATLVTQVNLFVPILTPDVPAAAPISVAAAYPLQVTPHLRNVVGTWDNSTATLATIANDFQLEHEGRFDFLAVVYLRGPFAPTRFFNAHSNEQNIGDIAGHPEFGDCGKLKGIIKFSNATAFDGAGPTLLHELVHHWGNALGTALPPLFSVGAHWPPGSLGSDPLGVENGHFDFHLSALPDGRYRLDSAPPPRDYADLTLYLMGLVSASAVGPNLIYTDPALVAAPGAVWHAPDAVIAGADVVAALGERVPIVRDSPTQFRLATILVTEGALADADTLRFYDWMAARAALTVPVLTHPGLVTEQSHPFFLATGGRARLNSALFCSIDAGVHVTTSTNVFCQLHDFGPVAVGASRTKDLFITRRAAVPVLGTPGATQYSVSLTNPADFALRAAGGGPLPAHFTADAHLLVDYRPASAGRHDTLVRVQSDDPQVSELEIELTGTTACGMCGAGASMALATCMGALLPWRARHARRLSRRARDRR